jgi:hypothetical protein
LIISRCRFATLTTPRRPPPDSFSRCLRQRQRYVYAAIIFDAAIFFADFSRFAIAATPPLIIFVIHFR